MTPYSYDWFEEIFKMHVPIIDSYTHYPAFYTVRLPCQTPTLMLACQAGRQFVPFLMVFGMTRAQTCDGYSALQTQHSMYLNAEPRAYNVNPSTLKIILSNTWIWGWSFKCGVLRNLHKFRARPRTYDGYSALYTQDSHSTLRIPPFKYLECGVLSIRHKSGAWPGREPKTWEVDTLTT